MHELFGTRFVSYTEVPWHGLGTVVTDRMRARAAFKMMGEYDVQIVQNPAITIGGLSLTPSSRTIVRLPTADDNRLVEFGTVGPEYTLIRPKEFVQIYDAAVKKPVETIGALREGSIMFISTKLGGMSIKGDDLENYLLVVSPMDGKGAASMYMTDVRVVCMNTLRAAIGQASEKYRLIHNGTVREDMGAWLQHIVASVETRRAAIKEAYLILAGSKAKAADVETVLSAAFPIPSKPRDNAPQDVMTARLADWDNQVRYWNTRKEAALSLYNGDGTGMDTRAAKGTLWGVWQAVVECADKMNTRNPSAANYDTLFGYRADIKTRGFQAAMSLTQPGKAVGAK